MTDKLPYPEEINERIENGMGCGSGIGDGWFDIVRELDKKLSEICPDYVVDQIKEKFGSLRYYVSGFSSISEEEHEEVRALIDAAAAKSVETCDVCGVPAKINTYNIAKYCDLTLTRCNKHVPK